MVLGLENESDCLGLVIGWDRFGFQKADYSQKAPLLVLSALYLSHPVAVVVLLLISCAEILSIGFLLFNQRSMLR